MTQFIELTDIYSISTLWNAALIKKVDILNLQTTVHFIDGTKMEVLQPYADIKKLLLQQN